MFYYLKCPEAKRITCNCCTDYQFIWDWGCDESEAGEGTCVFSHGCRGGQKTPPIWQYRLNRNSSKGHLFTVNLPAGSLQRQSGSAGANQEPVGSGGVDGGLEWWVSFPKQTNISGFHLPVVMRICSSKHFFFGAFQTTRLEQA